VGSDAPNAVLVQKIYCSHAQKWPPKTLEETLNERSSNARCIDQRFVLMYSTWYSTNNDGGVANSQWIGEGG
jgi:hypothetical protein